MHFSGFRKYITWINYVLDVSLKCSKRLLWAFKLLLGVFIWQKLFPTWITQWKYFNKTTGSKSCYCFKDTRIWQISVLHYFSVYFLYTWTVWEESRRALLTWSCYSQITVNVRLKEASLILQELKIWNKIRGLSSDQDFIFSWQKSWQKKLTKR